MTFISSLQFCHLPLFGVNPCSKGSNGPFFLQKLSSKLLKFGWNRLQVNLLLFTVHCSHTCYRSFSRLPLLDPCWFAGEFQSWHLSTFVALFPICGLCLVLRCFVWRCCLSEDDTATRRRIWAVLGGVFIFRFDVAVSMLYSSSDSEISFSLSAAVMALLLLGGLLVNQPLQRHRSLCFSLVVFNLMNWYW